MKRKKKHSTILRCQWQWQHGDHLGSASWVTDTNGLDYQHLQYMPWGEQWIDQRKTGYTYNTRYTFSGKERDEETGFSYFGARYYQPSLSIWLSVDPMSDKYPGTSPYTYCGNNPVRLVDPDGREVIIDGTEKTWVLKKLFSTYKNLNLTIDGSGKLQASIEKKTKLSVDEKHLLQAINSSKVSIHLTANNENNYTHPIEQKVLHSFLGGAFMGNSLSQDGETVITYQFISKKLLKSNYFSSDIGTVLGHEITESYQGGLLSIEKGVSAEPAKGNLPNEIYDLSHYRAITCPLTKETQRANFWAERGIEYAKLKPFIQSPYGKSFDKQYFKIIFDFHQLFNFYNKKILTKKDKKGSPPPSIYDSTYLWSYQVVRIEFMPTGAYCMYNLKDFYLIEVIDTTKTYAYTIISFCDETIKSCNHPIRVGEFYNFTLVPLEKDKENYVGGCYDRMADVSIDNIHVKISPPARIFLIVAALELKEIYYQPDKEND